jgi:tRNA nucleotidyltransferase (CCA-adding enzyme)
LAEARWAATRAGGGSAPTLAHAKTVYRRALRIAYRDPIELADLAVDGEDLQREGIARGPLLGKILRRLLEWVVEEPARNVRDQLLARARSLAQEIEREMGNAKT